MSKNHMGVPHGKCSHCGKSGGLYTRHRLCHACNRRRVEGELIVHNGVIIDRLTVGAPACHDEESMGKLRELIAGHGSQGMNDLRGFVAEPTAAGESLGVGMSGDDADDFCIDARPQSDAVEVEIEPQIEAVTDAAQEPARSPESAVTPEEYVARSLPEAEPLPGACAGEDVMELLRGTFPGRWMRLEFAERDTDLLEWLHREAEKQYRTPYQQTMYLLRTAMDERREGA